MSSNTGRPRTADHQRRKPGGVSGAAASSSPSGRPRPPRRQQPAGGQQSRRGRAQHRPGTDRTAASESALRLDRALKIALDAPQPPVRTFGELGLPAQLVSELAARGIVEPFAIQARALPDALAGHDVLGRAQTGSGKTLAFGLPMLARLAVTPARRRDKAPHGLVLVPTRELALQVAEVLVPLGRPLRLSVMTVYGGVALNRQIERLRRGVDIVVATPGRLIDLLDRGACTLDDIEITVLDEADHMADLGFMPDVTRILDATPAGGQRMLFSATLDRGVDQLVNRYLSDPALHAVAPLASAATDVEHRVFVLPASDKVTIAAEIGGRDGRTLIFVRTKHGADRLARQLTQAGVEAAAIHGNLNQNQRQRALAAFTAGQPRVLVATDVAARGIHVDDIGLVMHFDPPNDHKDYLHRSGRTARAGATGTVVALVEPGQVRDVGRMHEAAGVISTSHRVQPGHDAVRQIATSGTPIEVTQLPPPRPPASSGRPYRDRSSRGPAPSYRGRRPAPQGQTRYQRASAAS
jgi:superfamily II DNA/RNA helicase